jgi:hypothetical protein
MAASLLFAHNLAAIKTVVIEGEIVVLMDVMALSNRTLFHLIP